MNPPITYTIFDDKIPFDYFQSQFPTVDTKSLGWTIDLFKYRTSCETTHDFQADYNYLVPANSINILMNQRNGSAWPRGFYFLPHGRDYQSMTARPFYNPNDLLSFVEWDNGMSPQVYTENHSQHGIVEGVLNADGFPVVSGGGYGGNGLDLNMLFGGHTQANVPYQVYNAGIHGYESYISSYLDLNHLFYETTEPLEDWDTVCDSDFNRPVVGQIQGTYLEFDSSKHYAYLPENIPEDMQGFIKERQQDFIVYGPTYGNVNAGAFLPAIGLWPFNQPDLAYRYLSDEYDTQFPGGSPQLVREADSYYMKHFGMHFSADYLQPADGLVDGTPMIYDFNGDDDLWVFIDGYLALDIGGIHQPISGRIDFEKGQVIYKNGYYQTGVTQVGDHPLDNQIIDLSTLVPGYDVTEEKEHHIDIFYLERGGGYSNFRMTTNLKTVPPKHTLEVNKEVSGDGGDVNKEFPFTLELPSDLFDEYNTITYTKGNTTGEITSSPFTFNLKHGESILFEGIPKGTPYTVTEIGANTEGYATTLNKTVRIDETTWSDSETIAPPCDESVLTNDTALHFTNSRNRAYYNITVTKTITGDDADTTKQFHFTLSLPYIENSDIANIAYQKTARNSTVTSGTASFVNKICNFTLSDGESIVFSHIPEFTSYELEETDANTDRYTTTVSGPEFGSLMSSVQVDYVNSRSLITRSLSVNKTVTGNMGNKSEDFAFSLSLTGLNGGEHITYTKGNNNGNVILSSGIYNFTLGHGDCITFNGIPDGATYTVTETNANTNGYTMTVTEGSSSGTLTADASVTFNNHRQMAIPTDLFDKTIPFMPLCLLVGVAFAMLIVFLIKKKP